MRALLITPSYATDFQYKLIHRILITNSFLYKYGLKETELCTFCTETKESLVHIFGECNYVRNFWLAIGNFLKICGVSLPFNAKDIILGLTEHSSAQGTINNVLIILKYYIYVCKCKCRALNLEGGLEFLKYAINIEKASMSRHICPQYKRNMLKENGWIWRRY